MSAISEAPGIFHQNEKVLPVFERRVLAGEIATGNKRLLRRLLIARKPEDLHVALSKEQSRAAQEGRLLISWSDYIEVFALEDNLGLADWRLVRSLISIRVIEKLLELKAIDSEVLPEEREEETEQEVVVT